MHAGLYILGEKDGIETDLWPEELGLPYSRRAQAEGQGYQAGSEAVMSKGLGDV